MSTSIDQAFVRQYEAEVHHLFQRQGGILRPACRTKDNVVGKSTTFQRIASGAATTKARHGVITPANLAHTNVECPMEDFYFGDWVDRLDEAKFNIDERMAIAKSAAWGLGRKVDDQIFTALDATTNSGSITFTLTNVMTVENSLLAWSGALDSNDVPNDGERYFALTPKAWQAAMKVESFARADYVGPDGLPFKEGSPIRRWKSWMNGMWTVHTGLPGVGGASAKMFGWHKSAVGYATGDVPKNLGQSPDMVVGADITWHGDRAAHWVMNWMSGGAVLIEDAGVIEVAMNDTTALPTAITA